MISLDAPVDRKAHSYKYAKNNPSRGLYRQYVGDDLLIDLANERITGAYFTPCINRMVIRFIQVKEMVEND